MNIEDRNKMAHYISLIIGFVFLIPSLILAIFFKYPHFYTAFAFGGWLVLDFIDWKLNKKSILGFFYNHQHRRAFIIFFIFTTIFCFVIDYIYGVRLSGMWQWTDYKTIHFIRMYLFKNASYVLGMYELYRVIRTIFKKYVFKNDTTNQKVSSLVISTKIYKLIVVIGFFFILLPLYVLILHSSKFLEYIMLFPFIGMFFIADGFTGILGGRPSILKIFQYNRLYIISLFFTAISGAFVTEIINLFGGEWKYIRIPFPKLTLLKIPVTVFIGWIPLVLGSIALIHLIKQLDFIFNHKKISNMEHV